MRFYANENSILSGKRGAMAIEMLQNVIQSEGCLLRGHPRKGDRPRPHWVTTAFRAGELDIDPGLIELLKEMAVMDEPPRKVQKKKKVFRRFVKKKDKVVELKPLIRPTVALSEHFKRVTPPIPNNWDQLIRDRINGSAIFRMESLSLRWDKMTMEELLLAEKELSYRADLGFSLPAVIDHEAIKEYIRRRNEQS